MMEYCKVDYGFACDWCYRCVYARSQRLCKPSLSLSRLFLVQPDIEDMPQEQDEFAYIIVKKGG